MIRDFVAINKQIVDSVLTSCVDKCVMRAPAAPELCHSAESNRYQVKLGVEGTLIKIERYLAYDYYVCIART